MCVKLSIGLTKRNKSHIVLTTVSPTICCYKQLDTVRQYKPISGLFRHAVVWLTAVATSLNNTCDVCYNVFDCFVRDVCIPLWLWWLWPKRGRGVGWGCFYFTSFSRHAYLASTSFRFVLQVFYLLVTKVTIRYFLNRGNLVLV